MAFDLNNIISKIKYDPNSVKKDCEAKTDVYYAKVSYRYAYLKRILCVLLVLTLASLVLSGSLSYNKLYYLTKDLKLADEYVKSVHDTITYNAGNSQSFALYRGGLAVASREKLELFSASGKELFSLNHSYGNPVLTPSGRYILLCDIGGKQFSLYNSFSKLRDDSLEYPIYGADIADNGTFALITSSADYRSCVKVYGINGKNCDYNYSSGRVSALALSADGKRMAVVLTDTAGDSLSGEIRVYKVGNDSYYSAELTFSGVPYSLEIFDNGNICAVGAGGVNVFSDKLKLLGEYSAQREIYLHSFGDDNIVVAHLSDNSSHTQVVLINKYGKIEKKISSPERVLDMQVSYGYIFLQKLGLFERVNIAFGTSDKIELVATDFKILACDSDTLLACNSSYAKFLTFGK